MNVLTGYTKGTLSDNYLLSAAGGHIPLGNSSGSVPLSNNTLNKDLFADKARILPYFTIPSSGDLSDPNDATKLIPKYIKIGTINIPQTSWYRGSIMLIFYDYEIYKLNGDILMIQCTTGGNKVGALPAIRWKTKHDKSTEDSIILSKVDDNTYDLYLEAKFSWMTFYVYYLTKEVGVFNFNVGSWSQVKPNPITTRSTLQNVSSEALTLSPEHVSNLDNVVRDTFISGGFQATNTPYSNYFTGISLSNSELKYKYQFGFSTTGIPFVRYNNTTAWQPWKQLAFTSDISSSYVTLTTDQTITGLKTFESNSSTTGVSLILKNKGWAGSMQTAMDFYNGSNYKVPNARISTLMNGSGSAGGTLIFYTQTKASANPNPNGLVERFRIGDDNTSKLTGDLTVDGKVNDVTIKKLFVSDSGETQTTVYDTLNVGTDYVLASIRYAGGKQSVKDPWLANNYSAGIGFGGADTKGALSLGMYAPNIKFAAADSNSGWWLQLTGTGNKSYNLDQFTTLTKTNELLEDYLPRQRMKNPAHTTSEIGGIPFNVLALKASGTPLYDDPEFLNGINSVKIYNNKNNTNVSITHIDDNQNSANSSGKIIQISSTSGETAPGRGGFYQLIQSRKNAIFVQIFRAKIPVGYKVVNAENSMGAGYNTYWLTDQAGTGKWEWYCRVTQCGTANFSTGGHVFLEKTDTNALDAVTWYLSYCNTFDLSKGNYDGLRTKLADSVAWSGITNKPTSFTPSDHASSLVTSLSGYSKATSASDLATTDTLNAALGKLEYKSDYAYDWITTVTATDTDEYINKWGEIVDFLDSVKEGTDILDEFVTRKTDQTITGVKIFNSTETVFKSDIYGVRLLGHSEAGWLQLGQTNGDERTHYGKISGINGSYLNSLELFSSYSKFYGPVIATKFVTTNGTSSQFIKGDGSLDSNSYATKTELPNVFSKAITSGFTDAFRTQAFGSVDSSLNYGVISTIRCENANVQNAPQYGSGLAFGRGDTHSFLYTNYSLAEAYIGGGNADKLNWVKKLAFADGTGASGTWDISINGSAKTLTPIGTNDFNTVNQSGFISGHFQASNRPTAENYFTGISVNNTVLNYWYQFGFATSGTPYVRYKTTASENPWQSWKEVLTDKYLSYNTDRDFPNGTLITTSINYDVANGNPFYGEIKGNVYGDTYTCNTQFQGYIYNGSIINYGVTHLTPVKIGPITAMNIGGYLCFWFPRISYWHGYSIKVTTGYDYNVNLVTNVKDSVKPTNGTKVVEISNNTQYNLTQKHSVNISLEGLLSGNKSEELGKEIKIPVYNYHCTAIVNNTNHYPYHRIAYCDAKTGSWTDLCGIYRISQGYNEGFHGIFKIALRTNNASTGDVGQLTVSWLEREGFNEDAIQYGFNNSAGNTYVDVFYVSNGTYNGAIIEQISSVCNRGGIGRAFTLINSTEAENTTASNKLNSTEVYKSITSGMISGRTYTHIKSATTANTVVGQAISAISATSATGVQDYGSTADRIIKIGYSGTAATTATHFAVYQDDGTKIKDMSVANVKTLLNVPTKVSQLTNDLTYLARYGEGSKASVRTADRTVALCTGGWSGTETDFYGYGARYGTTLDISGFSTWYHRLAFATTGRIQYWQGINTKTLTHAGNIAFTYDIPTKVSQLTNDSNYATVSNTLGKSSTGIPNGSIVKVTVPSDSHYLITLRGTQGQRCALLYVSGYGSGGTSTRLTVRVVYSHANFEYYYNEASDSIGGIYVKNVFTGSAQNDTICVTSLNNSAIPTLTTVTTIPTGANKINSAECNLLTVDTADNYFVRNTGSLKNPNAIKFKNTVGTVVSYDGSAAVDLTGGVNNAKQLDGNAETSYLRYRGEIDTTYADLTDTTVHHANFKKPSPGMYTIRRTGSSEMFVSFAMNTGSCSSLEFKVNYPDTARLYIRKVVDSNRISGDWRALAWYSDIPTTLKNPYTLTFAAGTFAAKTYDGSAAVTVNIPTHTSHLTNNSGFLTSRGYIGNTAVQETSAIQALTGISGITFSGGNEYFDQYGNFHFGTAGTTWGVYHNDGSVLLKLTKSTGQVEAKSFKVTNGTYNQFLKADGSIDNNTYLTSNSSIPDTSITWSSTGLSGYTGPVSTALCGPLKGNRFAGIKAEAVSIEYSRDAGATWYDYEAAGDYFNSQKRYFFNQFSASFILGKNSDNTTSNDNYRLRVTVDCNIGQVYSELKKAILYVTTNNSNNCTVTVQTSNDNTTYTDRGTYYLIGWSGYNEIPLVGITADPSARGGAYSRYIRFLFSAKYVASSEAYAKGLTIMGIEVFGGVGWTTPNNHIAKYGRPYTFDYLGQTQFYNTVYPAANNSYNLGSPERKWYAIYASSFIGNVTGNATTATTASNVIVGTGATNAYRAIVVHNGNALYAAGTTTGKPCYNYATGDIKAKSFTTDGGLFIGAVTSVANISSAASSTGNLTITQSGLDITTSSLITLKLTSNWQAPVDEYLYLNINSNGNKPIKLNGNKVTLLNAGTYTLLFDGSNYNIVLTSYTTYGIATTSKAGLVKPNSVITKPTINTASTTSGKYYHVQMSSDGNMFVNVPWEKGSYTLPLAANGTRGGIQIGYSESGTNYAVKLSSEKAYVTVPWTDTKVKQTVKSDNVAYPLLLSPNGHTSGNAGEAYYDSEITLNPSTNTITANINGNVTGSSGSCTGNAENANRIASTTTSTINSVIYNRTGNATKGNAAGNAWQIPTEFPNKNAMILRMNWNTTAYGHDIVSSPNNNELWHRNYYSANHKWAKILDSQNCYGVYKIWKQDNNIHLEYISGKQYIPNVEVPISENKRAIGPWPVDTSPAVTASELIFLVQPIVGSYASSNYFYYSYVINVTSSTISILPDTSDPNNFTSWTSEASRVIIFHL